MPDYQDYRVDRLTDANVNGCHRFEIHLRRCEGETTLQDWRNAQSILFALKVTRVNLSDPEKRELVDLISQFLIEKRATNGPA